MADLSTLDIVIIGAGAAGLAAAHRLAGEDVSLAVLEARDRVGGRGQTLTGRSGAAVDLGCGWLHSADQNAWASKVEDLGLTLDKSPPSWTRPAMEVNFPQSEQTAYRAAFAAFEATLEEAAAGPDRPAADLMDPDQARWRPLLNAFSGYYNGAPFDDISVHDYAAYTPTDENWRVREGYGTLMRVFAADLAIRLETPVTRIDRRGETLRIETPAGDLHCRCVIVAVPTGVLADGSLNFDPPLPDKQAAADALPLGHVDKAFLRLMAPQAFEIEAHLYGRTDTAQTAAYTFRPMGDPVVEAFFGGDLAAGLEADRYGAFCAFAVDEIAAVLGSDMRKLLKPIAESRWGVDPYARGAYSHARPGLAWARAELARPVEDRIFFAGEACSPHAFSTAHGAYETGVAAAEAALVQFRRAAARSADGET
jgi:monoamine oxidase